MVVTCFCLGMEGGQQSSGEQGTTEGGQGKEEWGDQR